jgi:hypothetical protein
MMPAMTSIAVTASICASASEAALLVASFMPVSLDLGVTHRCARVALGDGHHFYSEHPATSIRFFFESPLSEYRPSQGRTAIRRHFDSGAAGFGARDGIFEIAAQRFQLDTGLRKENASNQDKVA